MSKGIAQVIYYRLLNSLTTPRTIQRSKELPHFFNFSRRETLPIHVVLGISYDPASDSLFEYSRRTMENAKVAYDLIRGNLKER